MLCCGIGRYIPFDRPTVKGNWHLLPCSGRQYPDLGNSECYLQFFQIAKKCFYIDFAIFQNNLLKLSSGQTSSFSSAGRYPVQDEASHIACI